MWVTLVSWLIGCVLLTILMAFLCLFYKIQFHLECLRTEQIQRDRYGYWKKLQRYRKLLNSKRHIPAVQDMNIIQPGENKDDE